MSGMRGVSLSAALMTGCVLWGAGCAPKNAPTMDAKVQAASDDSVPATPEQRVERLDQAVKQFGQAAQSLHGHGDERARRDLAETLASLQQVLELLRGPEPGGAFRQQMFILQRSRERLAGESSAPVEPTVNAAVRAATRALSDIASERYADDQATAEALSALRARVAELDRERGPIHGLVTAQALDEAGNVARRMADVLRSRLPANQPATAPAKPE